MLRRFVSIGGVLIFASATLLADFSYQQKSTITGGVLAGAMKMAAVFNKQAREPMISTVAVKGDRMVHRGPNHIEIIDLGSETFTSVDLQKKTYSTMTFAEFKQMLQQMQQKVKGQDSGGPDVQFKVSSENTGATKTIGPFDARETVIKMEMAGTGQKSGQAGSMLVITDVWIAPAASGYKEIRDFHHRMAEKLDWSPGGNLFAGRPDVAKGMAESMKQVGALDGMPVYEVMSMGAAGSPSNQPGAEKQQPAAQPSLGSVLGGRFGLGRKKDQQQSQPAPSSGSSNSLMEMTMEMSNFSSAPVDEAQFAIPAGFKQVEPAARQIR